MRWLDPAFPPRVDHDARIAEAEARVGERPEDPAALSALGDACFAARAYARARHAYVAAATRAGSDFKRWASLAEAHLWLRAPLEALRVSDQGLRLLPSGELHLRRGFALRQLGLADAARSEFERALALGPNYHAPLKALLRPLATNPDPAALLAFCEALDPRHHRNALVLGYRAAALSRLGRDEEACALVDLDRQICWEPIEAPQGYEDAADFNRALEQEILAQPLVNTGPGVSIDYETPIGPALGALRSTVRERIEHYLADYHAMGLDRALPPPPEAATTRMGSTILWNDGSNRQHLHPTGYVSTVYYVRVPQSVRTANDDRGALQIGPCDQRTAGHRACWGERLIKPIEGWLAIFPSHFFHDVIPTGTSELRISVPIDLEPVWSA